jgi:TolB-like protein/tetratricopeptide (TPR) repeat protein
MAEFSFFAELRRRKVPQAAAIYGAIAWGVTEVVVTYVEQFFLPQWVATLALIFFVVGFPIAMFLAWTFDLTAEGIHRTAVTSRRGTASIFASVLLLIAGTTGLFFLISPGLEVREATHPAAGSVAPNSVAVLPFVNVGGDPQDSYLVAGLSDELRDQLGRVSGLRMAARSSSVAAMEQGLDAHSMAARLGVANWVEGSVRRQGRLVTVSVQLIDSSNGLALWSNTYERGPQELLNVQQDIARAVIESVLPDAERVVPEPATRDPTANELMLLARHLEQQVRERVEVDQETLLEAVQLYRRATEADPGSALAFSRLAGALIYLGDIAAAEAPIFKALSINPELSEVQHTLGLFHWASGLVKEARADFERAVELNPNNPKALQDLARARWYRLNFEDVREMMERAVELDPLSVEPYGTLGAFLAIKNYPDDARQLLSEMEELFDGAAAFRAMATIWKMLGDVDKSIAWTIRARDLEPDNALHVAKLAEYYADIADFDTALALDPGGIGVLFHARRYEDMLDIAEQLIIEEPYDLQLRVTMANAYNAVGQFDFAMLMLTPTGLPESVREGFRSSTEWNGLIAMMNALHGAKEIEMARELAQFALDYGVVEDFDWYWNLHTACQLAVLEQDDRARDRLEHMQNGTHLAWDPILRDSPCFERYQDDPVYQATVRYFDERREMLRERLPITLAEFGVEL